MDLSIVFWLLMATWLVIGAVPHIKQIRQPNKPWGAMLFGVVVWLAVAILGWSVFGFVYFGPVILG